MNHRIKSREGPAMSRKIPASVAVLLFALVMACRTGHAQAEGTDVQPIEGFPEASMTIFPLTGAWRINWNIHVSTDPSGSPLLTSYPIGCVWMVDTPFRCL